MGKSKKVKVSGRGRSQGLADDILEDNSVKNPGKTKKVRVKDEGEDEFVDSRLSRKILNQAHKQQEELLEEHGISEKATTSRRVTLGDKIDDQSDSDEDEEFQEGDVEEIVIDEADEKALEQFMSKAPPVRRTLGDIIFEKITERKTELQSRMTDQESLQVDKLDHRVVVMYKSVGRILADYRSGKVPKAFKIVPSMTNWEQILSLTSPDTWSAAAVYQATRLFASNLNAKMAQRFFNLVLYPRVRDDIEYYKKLNFHLYQAVRRALFKPAGFFKGILLPLCESGTCTLREATIIAGILTKTKIPMLHSAAALLKIAEMEYNGANSVFIRILLDKKYALPYRVIDAIVFHFLRMETEKRDLPVLWHQSLLTFAQRYKNDLSSEQRDALFALLRKQKHPGITPDIRRELEHAQCRDLMPLEGATSAEVPMMV